MGRKKKRARLKPRTVWALIIGYLVVGSIVALVYLDRNAPDPEAIGAAGQGLTNAWGLFPVVVLLWPLFLVIVVVQAVTG